MEKHPQCGTLLLCSRILLLLLVFFLMSTTESNGNSRDVEEASRGNTNEDEGPDTGNGDTGVDIVGNLGQLNLEVNFLTRPTGSIPREDPLVVVDGPGDSQSAILSIDDIEEDDPMSPIHEEWSTEEGLRFLFIDESSMDNSCSICLETFLPGKQVLQLTCGHIYHDGCLITWMARNPTCPICRRYITF